MTSGQKFIFYLLIPTVLAIQNGARGSAFAPDLPTVNNILFWLPITVISWGLSDVFSRAIYWLARADRFIPSRFMPDWAPRLLILPLGGLIAAVFCYYLIGLYLAVTGDFFGALHQLVGPDGYSQRRPLTTAMFGASAMIALVIWTVINLVFDRLFGVPRLRPAKVSAAVEPVLPAIPAAVTAPQLVPQMGKASAPPEFLARLAPDPGRDLIAVEAQEHYIKVYTRKGNELLLYRFKDAVKDLAPYGLQVHRSHWVAKSAIAGVDTSQRALRLTLRNGQQVPVSTAYRGALKLAGVL